MKRQALNTMTKLAAVLAIAAVDAAAEDRRQAQQRIVVSIPDRKLVLFDGDRVVKTYDVAVGKVSTPTPEGEFQIINHIQNPTYYGSGVVIGPGNGNPLDGFKRKGLRDSRHQCSGFDWQGRLARLHPDAAAGPRRALRSGESRHDS